MKLQVPREVVELCRELQRAGHQAVTVGGAVRDGLLGRAVGDWDVATSATPEQVQATFRKTIPTGIDHGTVTVMSGRGDSRIAVEVTTFRGEGDYTDGRRPNGVTFGVPLHEDLARRDFVINAIAYDPIADVITDPFGGQQDLQQRIVRAVGNAEVRFAEDGLRVMRAIRFAAVLDFSLDADTKAAIPGALSTLALVSRERVFVEWMKLLSAPKPSDALSVAWQTGVVANILPELENRDDATWSRGVAVVARCVEDAVVRFGALLAVPGDVTPDAADALCERLKFSTRERKRVVSLVEHGRPADWRDLDEAAIRVRLAKVGRAGIDDLVHALEGAGENPDDQRVLACIETARHRNDPLSVSELALSGREIIADLELRPGPIVGELQRYLLQCALRDPSCNEPQALLELAKSFIASRKQ